MEDKALPQAIPPSELGAGELRSAFFDRMEALAAQRGQSVETVVRRESDRALDQQVGLTDECLLPDEVERLLASEAVVLRGGRFWREQGSALTPAAEAALSHADNCTFCGSMLHLLEPRLEARAHFLREVQAAAASRAGDRGVAVPVLQQGPSPGLAGVAAMVAAFLIALLAVTWPMALQGQPWSQAGASLSLYAVAAGLGGTVVGGVSWSASSRIRNQMGLWSSRMVASRPAAVWSGAVGLAMMAFTGFVLPPVASKVVEHQQSDAVVQALHRLAGERADDLRCEGGADRGTCALAGRLPVPGQVRVEIGEDRADVYWDLRGQRLLPVGLERALIRQAQDGSKHVRFASGATVPLRAQESSRYPVGTQVVAVTNGGPEQLQNLDADSKAAPPYRLVRTGSLQEK